MSSPQCSTCSKKTTEKDRISCSSGCGNLFHLHCSGLTAIGQTALRENASLKFLCSECRKEQISLSGLNNKCSKIIAALPNLFEKIEDLKLNLITDIRNQLSHDIQQRFDSLENSLRRNNPCTAQPTPAANPEVTLAQIVKHTGTVPKHTNTKKLSDNVGTPPTIKGGSLRSGKQRQISNAIPNTQLLTPISISAQNGATAVTPRRQNTRLVKITQTVIIKPNSAQDPKITKQEIQSSLDPIELEVVEARSLASGDLAIRCASAEAAQKLLKKVNTSLTATYSAEMQTALKPRLKIVGFANDINETTLCEKLKLQNKLDASSSLKIIRVANFPKQDNRMFAIIEPDTSAFEQLLGMKSVNLGWNRCRVYEQIDVRRCYNCSEYGHYADKCTKPTCCPKCAEGHDAGSCDSDFQKCVNCDIANKRITNENSYVDPSHTAWSTDCPIYQKRLKQTKQRTDYSTSS